MPAEAIDRAAGGSPDQLAIKPVGLDQSVERPSVASVRRGDDKVRALVTVEVRHGHGHVPEETIHRIATDDSQQVAASIPGHDFAGLASTRASGPGYEIRGPVSVEVEWFSEPEAQLTVRVQSGDAELATEPAVALVGAPAAFPASRDEPGCDDEGDERDHAGAAAATGR